MRKSLCVLLLLLPSVLLSADTIKKSTPLPLLSATTKVAGVPQSLLDILAKVEQDRQEITIADAAIVQAQSALTAGTKARDIAATAMAADQAAFLKLWAEIYGPAPPIPPLPAPVPVITSPLVATGAVGAALTYQIVATNGPTAYTATGLPNGLSIAKTTGLISGTPTKAGGYKVGLAATNSGGDGTAELLVAVTEGPAPPEPPVPPVAQKIQVVVVEETSESTPAFAAVRTSKQIRDYCEANGHLVFFLDKDQRYDSGSGALQTWVDRVKDKALPYVTIVPMGGGAVIYEGSCPSTVTTFLSLLQTYGGPARPDGRHPVQKLQPAGRQL